jgi:hypothetical protein
MGHEIWLRKVSPGGKSESVDAQAQPAKAGCKKVFRVHGSGAKTDRRSCDG